MVTEIRSGFMRLTKAIVRKPCAAMVNGLTSANLGRPDCTTASIQHEAYTETLEACGLEVTELGPDDRYPDSTFVEDAALVTPECAVITRPGAPSRRGETDAIELALMPFYSEIERITEPGTVDAGDIMMVGMHFFIGLSERTNVEGARQMIEILNRYGMTGSTVAFKDVLHLKSAVAYLENGVVVAAGEFARRPELAGFEIIEIAPDEAYAANCVWVNGIVLVAEGFPKTRAAIEARGYRTISLEMSEFQKLDGGLSCLSLRF